ncbi:MAG TPA: hypothetical protein VHV30_00135 [Polyangiaceae bacterium]|nr:hypothetical protein [Polyangiaceae bacterium]
MSAAIASCAALLAGCSHPEQPGPAPAASTTAAATAAASGAAASAAASTTVAAVDAGPASGALGDDTTALVNVLVTPAETKLREMGDFSPYGAVMKADGSIEQVNEVNEHPKGVDAVEALAARFRKEAREGKVKATGIISDVKGATLPDAADKSDAIAVRLDRSGSSVVLTIPYRLVDGQLVTGSAVTTKGDASIFAAR